MNAEQIKAIGLAKINLSEHFNFHNEAKVFMDKCGAENINCTTELDHYATCLVTEKENMRRQQASALTPQMDKADSERDALILFLFSLLDAGQYSPIEATKVAYQALHPAMQPYRGIGYNAHTQESADIQALVAEITAPALVAHTATMGMTEGIALLTAKNQEYIDLDTQRVGEVPSTKETNEVRKRTDDAYDAIVLKVNATLTLMPNEAAQTLASNINNLIDRTNSAYKQRIGVKHANDEKKKV